MKLTALMPSYLVVDSSILIFYDRKGKLTDFLQQKKKENYKILIPKAIAQEVVDEPKGVAEKSEKHLPSQPTEYSILREESKLPLSKV